MGDGELTRFMAGQPACIARLSHAPPKKLS